MRASCAPLPHLHPPPPVQPRGFDVSRDASEEGRHVIQQSYIQRNGLGVAGVCEGWGVAGVAGVCEGGAAAKQQQMLTNCSTNQHKFLDQS